jgi:hypothetical protein
MTVKLVPCLTRDQAFHLLDLPESERHDWVKERVCSGEIELRPEPDACDERFAAARLTPR